MQVITKGLNERELSILWSMIRVVFPIKKKKKTFKYICLEIK